VSPSDRRQRTAYHEAGHAVLDWRLGTRLRRATIIANPGDQTLGHVLPVKIDRRFDPSLHDQYTVRRRLEPRIVAMMAGVIAERRFTGRRRNWAGAESDLHEAQGLALHCLGGNTGKAFTKYFAWLFEESREWVEAEWPRIEAVAPALLERETLNGRELRGVIVGSYGIPQTEQMSEIIGG